MERDAGPDVAKRGTVLEVPKSGALPDEMERGTALAVYVFTTQGLRLAQRLAACLSCEIFAPDSLAAGVPGIRQFASLRDLMAEEFSQRPGHLFIGAAGIAVRAVAPHLAGKDKDPAVLVMDQRGEHVISLLSGHLGGANALTVKLAALLGARPVITTATDAEELPAVDVIAAERGCRIANLGAVKAVSAALLASQPVFLYDPGNRLGLRGGRWESLFQWLEEPDDGVSEPLRQSSDGAFAIPEGAACILVDEREGLALNVPGRLVLRPPSICAGIGCKRGAEADAIEQALRRCFAQAGLSILSLACLASFEAKRDEPGLLRAAENLGCAIRFFTAEELSAHPATRPSAKALETFGIPGVCEPAALAAASVPGNPGSLISPKHAENGITVALARYSSGPR